MVRPLRKWFLLIAFAVLLTACSTGDDPSSEGESQVSSETVEESVSEEGEEASEVVESEETESSDTAEGSEEVGEEVSEEESQETSSEEAIEDGTYEGTGNGFYGPITAKVTVVDGRIDIVEFPDFPDSQGIGTTVVNFYSVDLVKFQSMALDQVTGATVSYYGAKTALEEALTSAGFDIEDLESNPNNEPTTPKNLETDVLVIGSGAAGLSAAIEAAEAGNDVIVIEKLTVYGGSTITSSGMVVVGGSKLQEEAGIEDSVEKLKEYWLGRGDQMVNEEKIAFVADNANDMLDWLMDSGINYSAEGILYSGTADVPRAHIPPTFGLEFIDRLYLRAEAAGAQFHNNTRATELLTVEIGGKLTVVGALADNKGQEVEIKAKAVIIATGGFDHNEDLKAEYTPSAVDAWPVSAPGNTGDGLMMAMDIGADTVFQKGVIGWKVVNPQYGHTSLVGKPLYGLPNLVVNEAGDRFINEALDYPFIYEGMEVDGGKLFYFIFDSDVSDTVQVEATTNTLEALEAAVEAGVAFKADTLEELQEVSGLRHLVHSVETYNEYAVNGNDEYGRAADTMKEIKVGPFYAIQSQQATLGTFGGIKTQINGEVLDESGEAIPGLYAAGEVANGDFFGYYYPASGSSITMSVVFGREAGKAASTFVKGE